MTCRHRDVAAFKKPGFLKRLGTTHTLTMIQTTIAAIATPPGRGGIGIIKISGQDAVSIAASLFQPSARDVSFSGEDRSFQSHRLYHGHVKDPESGRVLDEVLLAVLCAPRSYTREDVVEIQAHAGPVGLRSILDLVLNHGARLAEPGEFTKRAYLSGRIDLTQAEAVIDIIHARTRKALDAATAHIRGGMSERIESVRDALLVILSRAEAAIDFPEEMEDEDLGDADLICEAIQHEVVQPLQKLADRYENAHFLREGLKTLIVGRPNVGKSSLMNALLGRERTIVTPVPGTTRDAIEDTLSIQGIPVLLTDTAGLHETEDPVEVLGIKRTLEQIGHADMILFVTDISRPLTDDDHQIHEKICHKPFILVANKSDLVADRVAVEIPEDWDMPVVIRTSALCDTGIGRIRKLVAEKFVGKHEEDPIVPNLRHKLVLERSIRAAAAAVDGLQSGLPLELVTIDLREAIDLLGEITGATVNEDVLDQIFDRFCIGK